MTNSFEICMSKFMARYVSCELKEAIESKKIEGMDNIYQGYSQHNVNGCGFPLRPLHNSFENGWAGYNRPWWIEKDLPKADLVYLRQRDDKFYPVFAEKHSIALNYLFRQPRYETKGVELIRNAKKALKTIKDGELVDAYAEFCVHTEELFNKVVDYGYGKYILIREGWTSTAQVCTGTRTVSKPTGNYVLRPDAHYGSNSYTLKAETSSKIEKVYGTVTRKESAIYHLHQNCWFVPIDKEEKERFLTVIKNQEEIVALNEQVSRMGIFDGKKKKRILASIESMLEYAYLVVAKACVDRNRDFYQDDMIKADNVIAETEREVVKFKEELRGIAKTAKKYEEVKQKLLISETLLKDVIKLKDEMVKQIPLIEKEIAELDKSLKSFVF